MPPAAKFQRVDDYLKCRERVAHAGESVIMSIFAS